MKRLKILISLCLALLCICSCNGADVKTQATTQAPKNPAPTLPKEPTPFPDVLDSDAGTLSNILESHVNPTLDELVETQYCFYRASLPRGIDNWPGNPMVSLSSYNNILGVQHITMIDKNHAYVIYKLVDAFDEVGGDYEYVYLYRFFEGDTYTGDLDGKRYEFWMSYGSCEVYYLTNSLSYKDFSDAFAVGDNMETAISVAPGLAFDLENRYDYDVLFYRRPEIPTQVCYQLLEDGVLILRFEANCTTDEWEAQGKPNSALICTDMEFYPNGTAATVDGIELTILTAPADKRPPLPQDTAD